MLTRLVSEGGPLQVRSHPPLPSPWRFPPLLLPLSWARLGRQVLILGKDSQELLPFRLPDYGNGPSCSDISCICPPVLGHVL